MKMTDNPKWEKAAKEENGFFTRRDVVKSVPNEDVPDDVTIIGITWET